MQGHSQGKGGSLGACTPPGIKVPTVMVPKFTIFVDFPYLLITILILPDLCSVVEKKISTL